MQRYVWLAPILLFCLSHATRQAALGNSDESPSTASNPPGLSLYFQTIDDRDEFRFGEAIVADYMYMSPHRKYVVWSNVSKIKGGRLPQISCEPSSDTVVRPHDAPYANLDVEGFLNEGTPCARPTPVPVAYEADNGLLLSSLPILNRVIVNQEVKFLKPGDYTCFVKAAQVTPVNTPRDQRVAIEVTSEPLVLHIKEDSGWSHEMLNAALQRFEPECRGKAPKFNPSGVPPPNEKKCWDAARTIKLLDTEESLTQAIRLMRAGPGMDKAAWQVELWRAIMETKHQDLAVKLLPTRLTDPNFAVTNGFVSTLTMMALRQEAPETFALDEWTSERRQRDHQRALELLRDYLRELGQSLPANPQ